MLQLYFAIGQRHALPQLVLLEDFEDTKSAQAQRELAGTLAATIQTRRA